MELSCRYYNELINNSTTEIKDWKICAIISLILALPTTAINISLIIAILTTTDRTSPCQKLLLNLAITDVGTGVVVMPGLFLVFGGMIGPDQYCIITDLTFSAAFILGSTSFLTITTVSLERFAKVCYPYTYFNKFNALKTRILIFTAWFLPILVLISYQLTEYMMIVYVSMFASIAIGAITVLFSYGSILKIAWSTRRRIHAVAARFGHTTLSRGDRKLVILGGLIVISMFLCYLPSVIRALLRLNGVNSPVLDRLLCWEWTFLVGNSLINPVISCAFSPVYKKRITKMWTCGRYFRDTLVLVFSRG